MNLQFVYLERYLRESKAAASKLEWQKRLSYEPDLNENLAEKAQHTSVCEHFSARFSFKGGHRWTFVSRGKELTAPCAGIDWLTLIA